MQTDRVETLRERKKRLTRETIAKTAADLFARRGYDGVTIGEVARAADVSEQTVYNYFPSKEHLVFDEADEFRRNILSAFASLAPGESPIAPVRAILDQFVTDVATGTAGGMPQLVAINPALRRHLLELVDDVAVDLAASPAFAHLSRPAARVLTRALLTILTTVIEEVGLLGVTGAPKARRRIHSDVTAALDLLEHGLRQS